MMTEENDQALLHGELVPRFLMSGTEKRLFDRRERLWHTTEAHWLKKLKVKPLGITAVITAALVIPFTGLGALNLHNPLGRVLLIIAALAFVVAMASFIAVYAATEAAHRKAHARAREEGVWDLKAVADQALLLERYFESREYLQLDAARAHALNTGQKHEIQVLDVKIDQGYHTFEQRMDACLRRLWAAQRTQT